MEDGNVVCPQCKGKGIFQMSTFIDKEQGYEVLVFCPKCKGRCEVDWITALTGDIKMNFSKQNIHIRPILDD